MSQYNDDNFSPDWNWEEHESWNSDHDFEDGAIADAERQIRIQQMRHEIEKRGGDWRAVASIENLSAESEEAILKRVLYLETAPRTTYAKLLIHDGIELTYPSLLDTPEKMHNKVWEVLHGLAARRVFLQYTNHLSEAELYDKLWYELLNCQTVDISWDADASSLLDLLGGGTDEDLRVWLTYFASDDEREWWSECLSAEHAPIPEHEEPPYARDRLIPRREDY